ncbi:hypothetical protein BLNAU_23110 [Blattamonas nauphoetae]|uniref:Uncharacterized protein n=1 Tax=Blattamonas nauphoetae TaxID=2049346 RepID=A0ABQ9WR67_9EUKA|nr:hypothetical protein BLNAU_23110 [Blattamonas nauphoetae]
MRKSLHTSAPPRATSPQGLSDQNARYPTRNKMMGHWLRTLPDQSGQDSRGKSREQDEGRNRLPLLLSHLLVTTLSPRKMTPHGLPTAPERTPHLSAVDDRRLSPKLVQGSGSPQMGPDQW